MHLSEELLEARHRLAELEQAWEMFIAKHNDEEEAQESKQRRRAAVAAQPKIASSYEWRQASHHRMRRQPLRIWLHLAARTMTCQARVIPARHRLSECSRQR